MQQAFGIRERRRYCRRAEGSAMQQAFGAHLWSALPLPPQECGGSLASGDFAISPMLEAALTTRCQPPSIISAYPSATSAVDPARRRSPCGAFAPLKSISLRSVLRFVEFRPQRHQKSAKSFSGIQRQFLDNSMPSSGSLKIWLLMRCDFSRRGKVVTVATGRAIGLMGRTGAKLLGMVRAARAVPAGRALVARALVARALAAPAAQAGWAWAGCRAIHAARNPGRCRRFR